MSKIKMWGVLEDGIIEHCRSHETCSIQNLVSAGLLAKEKGLNNKIIEAKNGGNQ